MSRPWTPDKRITRDDGSKSTRMTVKQACNGCGWLLGDVTNDEIYASIEGRHADVRSECPICSPPIRFRLRRMARWTMPAGAVSVARPSKWGNPFKVGAVVEAGSPLFPYLADVVPNDGHGFASLGAGLRALTVESVVEAHSQWVIEQPHLMLNIRAELGGRSLGCWCDDGPCHANFLLELANA